VEGERAEQKTRRAEQLESDNSGMASKLHEMREENEALLLRSQHMAERGAAHRQRLVLMISSRLLHRSTGRAFWAWRGNARVVREGRRKVGLVMRRWRQRDVLSACQTWYEHVAGVRKMRAILGKTEDRRILYLLNRPWLGWHHQTKSRKRLEMTATKIIWRLRAGKLAQVFLRWLKYFQQCQYDRQNPGILGVAFDADGFVIELVSHSPAYECGKIKIGDRLLQVICVLIFEFI